MGKEDIHNLFFVWTGYKSNTYLFQLYLVYYFSYGFIPSQNLVKKATTFYFVYTLNSWIQSGHSKDGLSSLHDVWVSAEVAQTARHGWDDLPGASVLSAGH